MPIASLTLITFMYIKLYTGDFAPRKIKHPVVSESSSGNNNTSIIIYPFWTDLGFMYYYDEEIFTSFDEYNQKLGENNIYRTWGIDDTKEFLKTTESDRIILYENNAPSYDPEHKIFNYMDSLYVRTDSVAFEGGLWVSVFEVNDSIKIQN